MRFINHLLIAFVLFFVGNCSTSPPMIKLMAPVSPDVVELEQELFVLVNTYRIEQGLNPLIWDDLLVEEARRHSRAMVIHNRPVGHDGFDERAKIIFKYLGPGRVAENVARNNMEISQVAEQALKSWIDSKEHREVMEGDFSYSSIGGAVDEEGVYYFTQLFWGK